MRIALFSDIHANLPAFEAFLNDLDSRKPDAIYCLGDMIGYNVWPNEIINEIRRRGIATLKGNHDVKTEGYAYELVSTDNRGYLGTLPAHIRLEFQPGDFRKNMLMVHGSPKSINEYILEDLPEDYVTEMMREFSADILCVAHSHKPYHRIIGDKHIINTGSVGKPKDGNPQGGYVLLTINRSDNPTDNIKIGIEFIRFTYDVEKAAKAVEESPLPDKYAESLRMAF